MSDTTHDRTGKVALVTGANTGIGRVTAEALARRGVRVFLAGRSAEKTEPVVAGVGLPAPDPVVGSAPAGH